MLLCINGIIITLFVLSYISKFFDDAFTMEFDLEGHPLQMPEHITGSVLKVRF